MPRDFRGKASAAFNPYANFSVISKPLPSDYHLNFEEVSSSMYGAPSSNSFVVHPLSFPPAPDAWRVQNTGGLAEDARERAKRMEKHTQESNNNIKALTDLNNNISEEAEAERSTYATRANVAGLLKAKKLERNPEAPYSDWEIRNFQNNLSRHRYPMKRSIAKSLGIAGLKPKAIFDNGISSPYAPTNLFSFPFEPGYQPRTLYGESSIKSSSGVVDFEDISWSESPIPNTRSYNVIGTTTPIFSTYNEGPSVEEALGLSVLEKLDNVIDTIERSHPDRPDIDRNIKILYDDLDSIHRNIEAANAVFGEEQDKFLRESFGDRYDSVDSDEWIKLQKQFEANHSERIQGLYAEADDIERQIQDLEESRQARGIVGEPSTPIGQELSQLGYTATPLGVKRTPYQTWTPSSESEKNIFSKLLGSAYEPEIRPKRDKGKEKLKGRKLF
jgi:hypothetical protein